MEDKQVLQFCLSGKTAFFKKPEVNTYGYFSYGNIHKVVLLGMFGAILGYSGYSQQKGNVYPEYYEKLNQLKVAIIPINTGGSFSKKMQIFNNAVGYANKDSGILNVNEQWLENPCWKIVVLLDNKEAIRLAEYICNAKCVYIPYLGTNDHFANISNAEIKKCRKTEHYEKIDSLFYKEYVKYKSQNEEINFFEITEPIYKYEEYLPVALEEITNSYILKPLVHTNAKVENYIGDIYDIERKIITFL